MSNQPYTQFENSGVPAQPNPIMKAQQEVDEVVGYMKTNVQKMLDREENLGNIEDKAERLTSFAQEFTTTSEKIVKKFWWQNCKWKVTVAIFLTITLSLLVLFTAMPELIKGSGEEAEDPTTPAPQ